ncbi:hypothetical protein [Halopiger djelfimassiliensis]|uniref:hypothetical protein n=1 Tax=Halopiger djelfimassiliensis TaxID=1293047 RepID=UPI00067772C6|nr:hypothetical protein [Halopiger djelfimassiliensis]
MTDRPPSPPTPTTPSATEIDDDRVLATTTQLAASIDDSLGVCLDDATLETVLLELDRSGYVDWVTVTHAGDYVWDLSDSPDRIADAVAAAVTERVQSWLTERTAAE